MARLFEDQINLYGFDPFDAAYDLSRWQDGLHPSSSLEHLNQYYDDGNDQQGVNDAAHRVAGQQPQRPQN